MEASAQRRWAYDVVVGGVLAALFVLLVVSMFGPRGPVASDLPRPIFSGILGAVSDVFPRKSVVSVGDVPTVASPALTAVPRTSGADSAPAAAQPDFSPLTPVVTVLAMAPAPLPPDEGGQVTTPVTQPPAPAADGSRTVSTVPAPSEDEPEADPRAEEAKKAETKARAAAAQAAARAEKAAARAAKSHGKHTKGTPAVAAAKPATGEGGSSNRPARSFKKHSPTRDKGLRPRTTHSKGKALGRPRAALKPKQTTVHRPAPRPPAADRPAGDRSAGKQSGGKDAPGRNK